MKAAILVESEQPLIIDEIGRPDNIDFGQVLGQVTKSNNIHPARTNTGHMTSPEANLTDPQNRKQKHTYDVAPAGNAVILEEQLMKSTENSMDYNLMTTLYQKNTNMLRMALGQ